MSWLPSHDPDEAILETKKKKNDLKYNYHRDSSKLPTEPFQPKPRYGANARGNPRQHHNKPRYSCNWASGGPGMQAFFLDSGQKSSGTGVFLPQRAGTNFHTSRRPACSPVILPSRVVQALNLNVHELGLQVSPRPDPRDNTTARGGELNSLNCNDENRKDDVSTELCVISLSENSQEIFLPKEWTY